MKRLQAVLFTAILVWIAALLQGLPLHWDEIEFFRATRWIGEGRLPFRDFWEHHLPLQWYLFAPFARLFANGPGADSIVLMRWAQVPLWIAAIALLNGMARRSGIEVRARRAAVLVLLASITFVSRAIEYRIDVPANLAYIGAFTLVAGVASVRRWVAFGAVMSLAVLSNMRLAPLVVISAVLLAFWRADERRWQWNGRALWMIAGVAGVAAVFVTHLAVTGSVADFMDDAIRYNVAPGRVKLDVDTFLVTLLIPFRKLDAAGIAYWLFGIAGAVRALREIRRPGILQLLAVLVVASLATIAIPEVQYDYHFQNPLLLMLPLAAAGIAGRSSRSDAPDDARAAVPSTLTIRLAMLIAWAALLIGVTGAMPWYGEQMQYQDRIMRDVDRLTARNETVWDGVGYALRRESPYRYWFLPTGVRMMAAQRIVPPYDLEEILENPPAAIIYGFRVFRWMEIFPRVRMYAVRHFVPLHRDLWIPGMSALIERRPKRFAWLVPRSGRYDVWSSDLLAKHPWLTQPLEYAATTGPIATRYEIPLDRLPKYEAARLEWRVNGVPLPLGIRTLALRKGARLELIGSAPEAAGVVLVPQGITTLCMAPKEDFTF